MQSKKTFKTLITISTIVFLLATLLSCGTKNNTNTKYKEVTVIDSNGDSIVFKEKPKSVVFLDSAFASIWKDAGGEYTGIPSDFEDFDLSIDEATGIGNKKKPNIETVISLKPDFIVYSIDYLYEGHLELIERLESLDLGINFYGAKVDSFEDYLYTLEQFAKITGDSEAYNTYGLKVKKDIQDVISKVPEGTKPKVLFIRAGIDSYDVTYSDNFVVTMLDDLKTENIGEKVSIEQGSTRVLDEQQILNYNPDYIFIVYTDNSTSEIEANLKSCLYDKDFYPLLNAVKNNKVHILDRKLFENKPNEKWAIAYQTMFNYLYE